ncbi:biotin--[acetyl-CoA-carboxylase] ligase [Hyphomonas sp.]|uniref:biotin--[acetyl-CoA-carboxylase] ligase n=1 Tax=Hyphomonas sp. TaxID=87 RepID=UPI0032D8D1FF
MSSTWPVYHLGVVDSTNTEARRRAKAGQFEDCWLVAEAQTAGRGRLQRPWISSTGNLFSTALFHEPGGIAIAARIPFAGALAVADVAAQLAPDAPVRLKWPNDARVSGAKISGILIETGGQGAEFWVAAGIGINVASAPEGAGQAATCLHALRGDTVLTPADVLTALRDAFERRLEQARQGFETLRQDWLKVAEGLGQTISVSRNGDPLIGVLEDMADDGSLVLRLPDGRREIVRAGDVSLIGSS